MNKPALELIALADRISGHLGPFNFITRAERELVVTTLRTAANHSGSERAGVDAYPRWRHKKRGTTYAEIGRGKIQSENWCNRTGPMDLPPVDMAEVVIYRSDDDGSLWVRPFIEFYDGRFEELATPPAQPALAATHGKPDGAVRACTCHPSDNPPVPCAQKFAYSECVKAEAKSQEPDAEAAPVAYLYEVDMGNNYWSQRYADAKPVGNRWQRNIRPLYTHPTTKPEAPAVSVDATRKLNGDTIVDLLRKHFNEEAFRRLTCKRWKDGIDIDHPTFAVEQFVAAIAALIAGGR